MLSPSYHSGQLSEMSLFCGEIFGPPIAFATDVPLRSVVAALPVAVPHDF